MVQSRRPMSMPCSQAIATALVLLSPIRACALSQQQLSLASYSSQSKPSYLLPSAFRATFRPGGFAYS